jgi:vesicle coat complex subunit
MKPRYDDPPPELAPNIEALQDKLLHTYLAALRDANPRVRKKAAHGLGGLGRAAAEAVPALRAACEDENRAVRQAARWALERISP